MDLINEAESMKSGGVKSTIKILKSQKAILEEKLHLFNVVNLAQEVENLKNEGFFESHEIEYLRIYSIFGSVPDSMSFSLCDSRYQKCNGTIDADFYSKKTIIENLVNEIDISKINNAQDFNYHFSINGNIKEKIFEKMLSDELRKSFEYIEIHTQLAEKADTTQRSNKPKL